MSHRVGTPCAGVVAAVVVDPGVAGVAWGGAKGDIDPGGAKFAAALEIGGGAHPSEVVKQEHAAFHFGGADNVVLVGA